jgi:hypothetical protein
MLTIEAYQHIRFTVHTFEPENIKAEMTFRIFLKRDSGTLTTGDFDLSVYGPTPSRGTITIRDDKVVIDIESGCFDSNGSPISSAWQKAMENGEYQLVREVHSTTKQSTLRTTVPMVK